jgi:hypothetical protein
MFFLSEIKRASLLVPDSMVIMIPTIITNLNPMETKTSRCDGFRADGDRTEIET